LNRQTILDQLKEQNTIIYSYTLRPGICKDLHYGIALASQIEDLQTVVELAKCVAKYYIRKKEVFQLNCLFFVLNDLIFSQLSIKCQIFQIYL
jgi:hypothetical protein